MKKPILQEISYTWTTTKIIQCMNRNQNKLIKYIEYLEERSDNSDYAKSGKYRGIGGNEYGI